VPLEDGEPELLQLAVALRGDRLELLGSWLLLLCARGHASPLARFARTGRPSWRWICQGSTIRPLVMSRATQAKSASRTAAPTPPPMMSTMFGFVGLRGTCDGRATS